MNAIAVADHGHDHDWRQGFAANCATCRRLYMEFYRREKWGKFIQNINIIHRGVQQREGKTV